MRTIHSLSDAELERYYQRYQAQLLEEDNVLLLDMTKELLKQITQELINRNLGVNK